MSVEPVAGNPQVRLADASELLRALSAPVRLAVVEQLASGPRCVHELVTALDVSQSLISQHLRVLRAATLVRSQRRGREIVYSLADQRVGRIARDAINHFPEA